MKKAFIDQILLGLFLFSTLIIIGATISDDTEARNKFYSLKKLTDNAALSAAKYYVNVNDNQDEAESISKSMFDETKLGQEIRNSVVYTWDFDSTPNTITVSVPNYTQDTFWYKFVDLASFNLNASSTAQIIEGGDITSSSDLAPFGINGCDESHLEIGEQLTFDLRGYSGYTDTDYTEIYGIDVEDGCSPSGNSNWSHFKNLIKDFYVEDDTLKNDDSLLEVDTDTTFCVPTVSKLSMEQDNDPKQISQSFANLENSYDLVGVVMDIALFTCGSTASNLIIDKFIKVQILTNPSTTYNQVKNDYDIFQFDVEIIKTTNVSGVKLIE